MKRILVVGGMMKGGGISQYIYQTYSHENLKNKYHIDIVIEGGKNDFTQEIQSNNWGTIYINPLRKNLFSYILDWCKVLFKGRRKYHVIHFHYDSLAKFIPIFLARIFGIKKIIVHSHSSYNKSISNSKLGTFLHKIGKRTIHHLASHLLACSDHAAEWFYREKIIENKNVIIAKNGIELEKYQYNALKRKQVRMQLNLTEKFVIGHVGRFEYPKNHDFIIDVFEKVNKKIPESILLLVGDGKSRSEIEKKVKRMELSDKVIFFGVTDEVNKLLQAMDIFLFPSIYEGLPLTLIEAQTSGLTCFISDTITKTVKCNDDLFFLSLEKDATYWAKDIFNFQKENYNKNNNTRKKGIHYVEQSGYDINKSSNELVKIYEE